MLSRKSNKADATLAANNEDYGPRGISLGLMRTGDGCWRTKTSLSSNGVVSSTDSKSSNEVSKLRNHVRDRGIKEMDRKKKRDKNKDVEILKEVANLEFAGNWQFASGER